jgi:hypothetical protein
MNSAASSARCTSGPNTVMPWNGSTSGAVGTRPRCGLSPNSPVHADGMRIEPAPSDPSAAEASPPATAVAEPPLEPPLVRCRSHGLRVTPNVGDSVNGVIISSGTLVLPRMTAPASRRRRTTSWSALLGTCSTSHPNAVTSPATSTSSLTAIGTPSNGRVSPAPRRASA